MSDKVFVLTLNWNGIKHLKKFIPSVTSQTHPNLNIVVSDNNSTDGSLEYLEKKYPEVHIVRNSKNLGYSKGFNRGISYCLENNARYILVSNNDVVLGKKVVSEALKLMRTDNKIGYISGKVYLFDNDNILQYAGGKINPRSVSRGSGELDTGQYEEIEEFNYMDDVYGLVNVDMIKEIGPYDEDFFYDWEEAEWNFRMRKYGYKILYNPLMKAKHRLHGSTSGEKYTKLTQFHHTKGLVLYHMKTCYSFYSIIKFFWYLFRKTFLTFLTLLANDRIKLYPYSLLGLYSGFKRSLKI